MDSKTIEEVDAREKFKQRFSALFENPVKNRDQIWECMVEVIRRASGEIKTRSPDDLADIKGDALTMAMGIVDQAKYNSSRNTAYDYFFTVVRRHMIHLAQKTSETLLGESDADVSLDDMSSVTPKEAARMARKQCPNNWRSFLLGWNGECADCQRNRFLMEKFLAVVEERANKGAREAHRESRGERGFLRATVQFVRQFRRALMGSAEI